MDTWLASGGALEPAGASAERLAMLFWLMAGCGAAIWAAVVLLMAYGWWKRREHRIAVADRLIIGGGVVFPAVTLAALLAFSMPMLAHETEDAPPGSLRLEVTGHQWWWRVRYVLADGRKIELANEIHLPVGEPAQLVLTSADVIHSLWAPQLGGKVDMIPGRTNRLRFDPSRVGEYRGICAEYCGGSHAYMFFTVVVEQPAAFAAWLARQEEPGRVSAEADAARGREQFVANGCGACHTVRGTEARGTLGPDLTHVGSRRTLGAGRLPNDVAHYEHWLVHTGELKPGVLMPEFAMLAEADVHALGAYLESLQ